jgi:hypothetical protein
MATDLITLDEYLAATGQDLPSLDPDTEAKFSWSISVVSEAIRSYCDRDFTLSQDAVQGTRNFRYRGHNQLEIDDCSVVNSVAVAPNNWSAGRTLDSSEWIADDMDAEVFSWLEVFSIFLWSGGSPVMGFKNNLDQYPARFYPTILTVNAVWGWTQIPLQVKQAAVIAVTDLSSTTSGNISTSQSQSIASYSTSTSLRGVLLLPESALPYKAQALLDRYAKISV